MTWKYKSRKRIGKKYMIEIEEKKEKIEIEEEIGKTGTGGE